MIHALGLVTAVFAVAPESLTPEEKLVLPEPEDHVIFCQRPSDWAVVPGNGTYLPVTEVRTILHYDAEGS